MRSALKISVSVLFLVSIIDTLKLLAGAKNSKISAFKRSNKGLEKDVLMPDAKGLEKAQKENSSIIRIHPREKYDHKLANHQCVLMKLEANSAKRGITNQTASSSKTACLPLSDTPAFGGR